MWLDLKTTILDSAKKTIPTQRRKKATPWLSQEVIDLSDERRQLKEAGLKSSQLCKIISSEIQQKARRDKNDHIKKLCQELEDHSQSNSSRNLFRLAVIKDEDGKILTESEEIKDRWKRYCEELYASQETDGVPDNTDEDSCEDEQDIGYQCHSTS